MEDRGVEGHGVPSDNSENAMSESHLDPPSTCPEATFSPAEDRKESAASFNKSEIFKAIQVVEKESLAIAGSFTALFDSLRSALSEVRPFFFFLNSLPMV